VNQGILALDMQTWTWAGRDISTDSQEGCAGRKETVIVFKWQCL
jgi:hypothetical protein